MGIDFRGSVANRKPKPFQQYPTTNTPQQQQQQRGTKIENNEQQSAEDAAICEFEVQVPDDFDDDDGSVVSELGTPEIHNAPKTPPGKKKFQRKKKKAPKALPSDSHLLEPTTASVAGSKRHSTGNRRVPADRQRARRDSVDVTAAQDLARSRVKAQRRKDQQEHEKEERRRSLSAPRQTRISAEEGQARARARVKLRELKKKALAVEAKKQGKDIRAAAKSMGSRAEDIVNADDLSSVLTTLEMDHESFRSYMRDDDDQSISEHSRRTITVPRGPKFLLDAKYGEKTKPKKEDNDYESDDDYHSVSSISTTSTRRSITVPRAPRFLLDAKYGAKGSNAKKSEARSILKDCEKAKDTEREERAEKGRPAERSRGFLGRFEKNRSPKPVRKTTAAAPAAPFRREAPKSAQELEEMEMKKQFKARPLPKTTNKPRPFVRQKSGTNVRQ